MTPNEALNPLTPNEALNPLRSLNATFETMNLQPAHLWGGSLLLIVVEQITGVGLQFIQPLVAVGGEAALVFVLAGACVAAVGSFALATWLMSGLFLTFRSTLQTGGPTREGLFDHQGKFVPLILTRLLVVICSILLAIPGVGLLMLLLYLGSGDVFYMGEVYLVLAFLVCYGLIIYSVIGVLFAESAVIFEDLRPTEAIKRSWSLASGRRWRFVWFFFVNGIFALLGFLLCCVGIFATSAVTRLATAEAYLQLSGAGSGTGDEGPVESDPERLPDFP
ncbi:MAG: glycerophosphoryl diester phosphodiesterase membrane domain-containing protein [Planctomycetes bacterium]|nr:glycerophosphoryl diester phosphodiesterase membrane domain-containing protein [Planctomycetota bacterium]